MFKFKEGARWWRFYTYAPENWSGPRIYRGGDEYGFRTLVLNLPYFGALVIRYYWDEAAAEELAYGPEGYHVVFVRDDYA